MTSNCGRVGRIAILPWGDTLEDFLSPIGLHLEDFRDSMSGGWLFGYVQALQSAGVEPVLVCISEAVQSVTRWKHRPTGASLVVLPPTAAYRLIKKANARGSFAKRLKRTVAPYLATPAFILDRELLTAGIHAVLCQEYEYPRFDWCIGWGAMRNIPIYASFQGGDSCSSRLERTIRLRTLPRAAGIIIASERERIRISREYGITSPRVAHIFNPLDLDTWHPESRIEARAKLGIPATSEVVFWHGRIDIQNKGLDILIEAWRLLTLVRPQRDLRLYLVGAGKDAAQLDSLLTDHRSKTVFWRNEYLQDRNLMRSYLAAADVYAFSSRHEGFPSAPLEAMACGLPVASVDTFGTSDMFPEGELDGGLIAASSTAAGLAEALGSLLDDPLRRSQLAERARSRIESAFTVQAIGRQLTEFLNLSRPEPSPQPALLRAKQ